MERSQSTHHADHGRFIVPSLCTIAGLLLLIVADTVQAQSTFQPVPPSFFGDGPPTVFPSVYSRGDYGRTFRREYMSGNPHIGAIYDSFPLTGSTGAAPAPRTSNATADRAAQGPDRESSTSPVSHESLNGAPHFNPPVNRDRPPSGQRVDPADLQETVEAPTAQPPDIVDRQRPHAGPARLNSPIPLPPQPLDGNSRSPDAVDVPLSPNDRPLATEPERRNARRVVRRPRRRSTSSEQHAQPRAPQAEESVAPVRPGESTAAPSPRPQPAAAEPLPPEPRTSNRLSDEAALQAAVFDPIHMTPSVPAEHVLDLFEPLPPSSENDFVQHDATRPISRATRKREVQLNRSPLFQAGVLRNRVWRVSDEFAPPEILADEETMPSVAPSVPAAPAIPDSDTPFPSTVPDAPTLLDSETVTIPTRESSLPVQQCGAQTLGKHEIHDNQTHSLWPFALDAGSMLSETLPVPDNRTVQPPKSQRLGNAMNR